MSNQIQVFRQDIQKLKPEIEKLLNKNSDRFLRIITSYIQTNPKLLEVEQRSLYGCLMEVAALDLEVGTLGQADIIPYKGKAKLVIGYQGFITLIYRSGMVKSVFANVVREKDKFEIVYGTKGKLVHKPSFDTSSRVVGAYAYAQLTGGGEYYDYLPVAELERIRKYSAAPNSPAWTEETLWMYRKTMIRQLIKLLPKFKNEAEIIRAIKLDEAGERNAQVVDELKDTPSITLDYGNEVKEEVQELKERAVKTATAKKIKKNTMEVEQEPVSNDPVIQKINNANSRKELREIFSSLTELEQPVYLDMISKRDKELANEENDSK